MRKTPPSHVPEPDRTLGASTETLAESRRLSSTRESALAAAGPSIPGYALSSVIGHGSFAQVWLARQVRTGRTVAIKVFRKTSGVNWLLLQREVDLLIRLDKHPHVISLLDANLAASPPFYVMEHVAAGSLQRFVDRHQPIVRDRAAAWMWEMASALGYVHAHGLVHCDLKPGNVLLDGEGHVRVADFGQARVQRESERSLGTLGYMAPEQAVMDPAAEAVTPSASWDVYALGATLYAVLTGRSPHARTLRRLVAADADFTARLAAYAAVVRDHPLDVARDAPAGAVDRDLAAIVNRCLAVDPGRRYPTIAAVAADLSARREHRPVTAVGRSPGYRAGRFLFRHRELALTVLAAAVGTGVLAVHFASVRGSDVATLEVMRAEKFIEIGDLDRAATFYADLNHRSPAWRNRAAALLCLAPPAGRVVSRPPVTASAVGYDAVARAMGIGTADWNARAYGAGGAPLGPAVRTGGEVRTIAVSVRAGRLFGITTRGTGRLWRLADGQPVGRTVPVIAGGPAPASFAADGPRLAVGDTDGLVRLVDPAGGAVVGTGRLGVPVTAVAFDPAGARVAAGGGDGRLGMWAAADGRRLAVVDTPVGAVSALAFAPDGDRIAAGGRDQVVVIRDSRGGTVRIHPHAIPDAVAFAPDGRTLAVAAGGVLRLWDVATGEPLGPRLGRPGPVAALAWNGRPLALTAVGRSGVVRVWSLGLLGAAESDDRLLLRALVRSGRRVNADGRLEPIPPVERRNLARRLAATEREAPHGARVAGR